MWIAVGWFLSECWWVVSPLRLVSATGLGPNTEREKKKMIVVIDLAV